MSFSDVKKEIFDSAKKSGKTSFSEGTFNKLTSALVNEPDYEVKVSKSRDGKQVEEVIKPVEGFRKAVIGGIAKSAGADGAEVDKLVNDDKFAATVPWYPIVSEAVSNSLEAGKSFAFIPKDDLNAVLTMENIKEEVKMIGAPGSSKEDKKPVVYGAHRRIKSASRCPKHLRMDK